MLNDLEPDEEVDPSGEFTYTWRIGKQMWKKYRERIFEEWVRSYPGTRPSQWWKYESPEPRKVLGGTGMPVWERYCNVAPTLAFGLPVGWCDGVGEFETQHAYLKRLGLLFPEEGNPIEEPIPVPYQFFHWEMYRTDRPPLRLDLEP